MRTIVFFLVLVFPNFFSILAFAAPTTIEEENSTDGQVLKPTPSLARILESIDSKLSYLEAFKQASQLSNLESALRQIQRKVEAFEIKLDDIESKLDVEPQAVGLEEESLIKKLESLNNKVISKLNIMDIKLETKLESLTRKVDRLSRETDRANAVLESMRTEKANVEYTTRLSCLELVHKEKAGLKQYFKDELLRGMDSRLTSLETAVEHKIDILRKSMTRNVAPPLEIGHKECSCSNQSFGRAYETDTPASLPKTNTANRNEEDKINLSVSQLNNSFFRALSVQESVLKELNSKVDVYSRKFGNNFQEAWKHSEETNLKLQQMITSSKQNAELLQAEVHTLFVQLQSVLSLNSAMGALESKFEDRIQEIGASSKESFTALLTGQSAFIDNCNRIQKEEELIYGKQEEILKELRKEMEKDSEIYRFWEKQHNETGEQIREVKNLILQIGKSMKEKSTMSSKCLALGTQEMLRDFCKNVQLPKETRKVVLPTERSELNSPKHLEHHI